ncbi:Putative Mg2+ and Co2+ transporter CorB [Dermatophilus congolensis]|uniref:Mg2+ and Co2+ transporter CorB n=1 Tax=Dermatophilus congolensis TaxID=1863 RepID=A0AA46BQA5_9MICO|nr:hemolysin family protein [Dermatophilus congolensis]STD15403.1 Putative Mg2+ and Co2+ transporter CorB [Dermatophilus congolensis]
MNEGAALAIMLVFLVFNAIFVAAEFALVSVRRDQLEPLVHEGKWSARITMKVVKDVNVAIAGTQLGITASSLAIGAVGEPALHHLMAAPFAFMGAPAWLVGPAALVLSLVIVIYLHMVLAEMVPKNIALAGPLRASLVLGPFMYFFDFLARPFLWLMNATANVALKLMRVEPKNEVTAAFDRDQVRSFIEESGREGVLDEDETALLAHALDFETGVASDVALPADSLRTVPDSVSILELEQLAAQTGFSRFPVVGGKGMYIGYVHVKDVLGAPDASQPAVPRYLSPLPSIPADMGLREVVRRMQRSQVHLAVLTGEEGVPAGSQGAVIALEDVLEELVGDVREAIAVPDAASAGRGPQQNV